MMQDSWTIPVSMGLSVVTKAQALLVIALFGLVAASVGAPSVDSEKAKARVCA
jgi:hypothetical protein